MKSKTFQQFDPYSVPSPCFVVDVAVVEQNLQKLALLQQQSGAKVLAALKAFSCWHLGELTTRYLSGVCASGLLEAKLGERYYGGEVHTFSAAFKASEMDEILSLSQHVVFNSISQWQQFRQQCLAWKEKKPSLEFGLRINPQHSEGDVALYDPCAPGSRLGIPLSQFDETALDGISGLHFHTLCEQDFLPLQRTLAAVEKKFGHVLPQMSWLNFGGGHHITRDGYQFDALVETIQQWQQRYQLQVYLEPGEAVAIHSGVLVAEVLDMHWNDVQHAILDTSATCHMPDTLEMPYRADVFGAGQAQEFSHQYRLGGMSCLAGDVIGDYSFAEPLSVGQRLMFDDMAHYTMVKTTMFNGIQHPAIALWDSRSGELNVVRRFDFADFAKGLG